MSNKKCYICGYSNTDLEIDGSSIHSGNCSKEYIKQKETKLMTCVLCGKNRYGSVYTIKGKEYCRSCAICGNCKYGIPPGKHSAGTNGYICGRSYSIYSQGLMVVGSNYGGDCFRVKPINATKIESNKIGQRIWVSG